MTHTPTPWKVYQFGGVQVGQEDTGEAICSMWGDKHEGEANAAHIVNCVNLHDELVEALIEMVNTFAGYEEKTFEEKIETALKASKVIQKAGAL